MLIEKVGRTRSPLRLPHYPISTFELAPFNLNPTCTALKLKKPNSNQFKNPIALSTDDPST
ncbi:hypothetical protein NDA01_28590 [Trichocoleus desertorum AS-A10]|uniref:hypothetical protein n=1 Tax=Trichocoleus desertorum TaxID=1481672 RepID=UPI00329A06FE